MTPSTVDLDPPSRPALDSKYECELSELDPGWRSLFHSLSLDDAARKFIHSSRAKPHGRVKRTLQLTLRRFLSDFDVNGLLGAYPMHLLSAAQWRTLLGANTGGNLLDIGAGDGGVTAALASLFQHVSTTETSRAMAWRLRRRGYTCYCEDVSHVGVPGGPYDAISLLNVLDRCAAPLSLLSTVTEAVKPGGILIIALALPYRPFFYESGQTPRPLRPLPLNAEMSFESSVNTLLRDALLPLGVTPVALSRAPYLSWGDTVQSVYFLDNSLLVCRRVAEAAPTTVKG